MSPIGQFIGPQFPPPSDGSRLSDEVIAALAEDLLVPRRRQVSHSTDFNKNFSLNLNLTKIF